MKAALEAMAAQAVNVAISILLIAVWLGLTAYLDGPTETDEAHATALNVQDAIQQARVTAKEKP